MSSTSRQVENMGRTIVLLREELEVAQARIAELQAAYAAEQAKATRLERAALPQPVSDYLATLRDEAAFLYGNTDIGYSGSQEALSRHTEVVDRVEDEVARLRDGLRKEIRAIDRYDANIDPHPSFPEDLLWAIRDSLRALLADPVEQKPGSPDGKHAKLETLTIRALAGDDAASCRCPSGSYNPGAVHEPYCPLAEDGAAEEDEGMDTGDLDTDLQAQGFDPFGGAA